MNSFTLVRKGLTRRKLRTVLLIVSITTAFVLFGCLSALRLNLTGGIDASSADVLVVSNRINFTQPLPIAYVQRIRQIVGVSGVTHQTLLAGRYREPRNIVVMIAVDPQNFFSVRRELTVMPANLRGFVGERRGILVGTALAERYGWRVGNRIAIQSAENLQGGSQGVWDFVVAGTFQNTKVGGSENFLLLQYEYMNQRRVFGKDTVGSILVRTEKSNRNDAVISAIDHQFRNSSHETSTMTEEAFGRAFLAQLGNITLIVTVIVGASLVTILLIVGNTMMMSVRERTREIGVLMTIGYQPKRILLMVLSEALLLSFVGGTIGLLIATAIVKAASSAPGTPFPSLTITALVLGQGIMLMVLLGLLTGIVPAVSAMRLQIVNALGRN